MRSKPAVPFPVRSTIARLALALVPAALLLLAPVARAQFSAPETTRILDASSLKPPAGAHVAMIEFYDLECPVCATTNPTLIAAANQYKIPWVRHDFLIPGHIWSRQAAINARFFDATKGQKVGNEYRDYVMANQTSIETAPQLNQWTLRFAQAHGITMPFAVDPMGKFAAQVDADVALGKRIGIQHTPTVFIVASGGQAPQYTEVTEPRTRLFQTIDQVMSEAKK